MPRQINWDAYTRLTNQLLTVVGNFLAHDHIDYETMMAVLVLFQASMLTGPVLNMQHWQGDIDTFLTQYTAEITRMVRVALARAQAEGIPPRSDPRAGH